MNLLFDTTENFEIDLSNFGKAARNEVTQSITPIENGNGVSSQKELVK